MKRYRALLSTLAAFALVAGMAGPAAANAIGIFTGVAKVGKTASFCNHNGTSDVSGPGIGLPNGPTKNAFYSIDTNDPMNPGSITVINDATKEMNKWGDSTGRLRACGRLGPVGPEGAQIGAACGMSKGYHGKGSIIFNEGEPKDQNNGAGDAEIDYWLHNITWKLTEAGTIVLWASGSKDPMAKGDKGEDMVLGEIQAQGGQDCLTKTDPGNPKGPGARRFIVAGAFEIINDAWNDPQDPLEDGTKVPFICKETGNATCFYKDKKEQTPKLDR